MNVYKKEIHLRLRFSVHVAIFVQRSFYDRDTFLIRKIHEIKHSFGQTNFFWLEFNIQYSLMI